MGGGAREGGGGASEGGARDAAGITRRDGGLSGKGGHNGTNNSGRAASTPGGGGGAAPRGVGVGGEISEPMEVDTGEERNGQGFAQQENGGGVTQPGSAVAVVGAAVNGLDGDGLRTYEDGVSASGGAVAVAVPVADEIPDGDVAVLDNHLSEVGFLSALVHWGETLLHSSISVLLL